MPRNKKGMLRRNAFEAQDQYEKSCIFPGLNISLVTYTDEMFNISRIFDKISETFQKLRETSKHPLRYTKAQNRHRDRQTPFQTHRYMKRERDKSIYKYTKTDKELYLLTPTGI